MHTNSKKKGSIDVFENSFWTYGSKRILEMRMIIFENLKIIFEILENNFYKHMTKKGNQNK